MKFKQSQMELQLQTLQANLKKVTAEMQRLNAAAANVSFAEIESDKGHDAFLLDEPEFHGVLKGFLDGAAEHWINDQPEPGGAD